MASNDGCLDIQIKCGIISSCSFPPRADGGEDELQDDAVGQAGQELEKDSRQQVGLAAEMVGKLIFTFVF